MFWSFGQGMSGRLSSWRLNGARSKLSFLAGAKSGSCLTGDV